MKKIIFAIVLSLMFLPVAVNAQNKLTPSQVLSKTAAVLSNPKGVSAQCSVVDNAGFSGKISVKTLGNKFYVSMPEGEVWYNGSDLYTYNRNTKETTVVKPTAEELAESNPLAYVGGASATYNVTFSTVKKSGKYVLELTPKSKGSEIKRVTLTVRQSDFVPEKIVVEASTGNPLTADITSFQSGASLSGSDFEYPKSKYPNAEIIDLR